MSRPWVPLGVVACAVLIAVVIVGWPDRHKDAPLRLESASTTVAPTLLTTTTAAPASTTTAPAPAGRPPASVHVIVFNASAVAGTAGRVSANLKGQGYVVGAPGPDRKPAQDATDVLYRAGFDAEAKALAAALGLDGSSARAADASPAGWGSAEVAVVVGNDVARRA